MDTAVFLQYIVSYKYLALFVIAVFEGPLVCLFAGFLVFSGYLSIIPTYITMVLGDFIPDIIYYFIGVYGDKKKLVEKGFVKVNFTLMVEIWSKITQD